jgi:hypothetical protein
MRVDIWTVAEAKARLSEVIDRAATKGPQTVTRNGLAEFLGGSPLRRSNLRIERRKDRPRKAEL